MKTRTADQILEYIGTHTLTRPADLVRHLGLSRVAVHKHLAKMVRGLRISKIGKPPKVFYTVPKQSNGRDILLLKPTPDSLSTKIPNGYTEVGKAWGFLIIREI